MYFQVVIECVDFDGSDLSQLGSMNARLRGAEAPAKRLDRVPTADNEVGCFHLLGPSPPWKADQLAER